MNKAERSFITTVWDFYKIHGRSLPWRKTENPYRILISEVMLQQTQVDRVISKYKSFLRTFPSARALAHASLCDVLKEWQGLGYNRRAKNLHACAKAIVEMHGGRVPKKFDELLALPGVGPYTAGAIMAFAYNKPLPLIETNIRTAYLHHFFSDRTDVTDKEIMRYIALTLDHKNPREWLWALMDYGAYIKKEFGNPNSRSRHYMRQSAFNGSDRQIRGAVIRILTEGEASRRKFHSVLTFDVERIDAQLECLLKEGMIAQKNNFYFLPV